MFNSKEIEFGEGVFSSSGIKSFSFPPENTEVPAKFFQDANRLFSVSLPHGLNRIGTLSFSGTKNLRSIDLGFRIKDIPDGAFLGSAIESISLPHSIKRIGVAAFSSASNLKSIWYDGVKDEFRNLSFGLHWNKGIRKDAVLYIKDDRGGWVDAFSQERKEKEEKINRKDEEIEKNLKVLGFDTLPTHEELNKRYRLLSRKFHPDSISSLGLDQEYLDFASRRFQEIHEAYLDIVKLIKK